MKTSEEIRREIISPETRDLVKTLEELDRQSITLAGSYINGLADRQKIEEAKQTAMTV